MEGGELFSRIQEKQNFNEQGELTIHQVVKLHYVEVHYSTNVDIFQLLFTSIKRISMENKKAFMTKFRDMILLKTSRRVFRDTYFLFLFFFLKRKK